MADQKSNAEQREAPDGGVEQLTPKPETPREKALQEIADDVFSEQAGAFRRLAE